MYDVIGFAPANFAIKKADTQNDQPHKAEIIREVSAFVNTISQINTSVNTNISNNSKYSVNGF